MLTEVQKVITIEFNYEALYTGARVALEGSSIAGKGGIRIRIVHASHVAVLCV